VFVCLSFDLISELVGVLWVQRFGSWVTIMRSFSFRHFKFPCSLPRFGSHGSSVPEDPWTCTSDFRADAPGSSGAVVSRIERALPVANMRKCSRRMPSKPACHAKSNP